MKRFVAIGKFRLKDLRKQDGTIREVAKKMNVHYAYLNMVENGKRYIRLDNAVRIAKYFGYAVEDIFKEVKDTDKE